MTMLKTLIGLAMVTAFSTPNSGLEVGDSVTSFHPHHVFGAHKGTDACPT